MTSSTTMEKYMVHIRVKMVLSGKLILDTKIQMKKEGNSSGCTRDGYYFSS